MGSKHTEIAMQVLGSISYGTLATVSESGAPWNCPVIMVHDLDANFYWFSDRESQHGRNVRRNPDVFIVMYDSTVPKNGLDHGLYVQAKAHEVDDDEMISHARSLLWGPDKSGAERYRGNSPRRVYQAVPERLWVNDIERDDKGKFVRDYRIEVTIKELQKRMRGAS